MISNSHGGLRQESEMCLTGPRCVCVWWSGGTLTGQAQWKGSPSSICAAGFWGGKDTRGPWKSPFKKRMLWTLEWWGKGLIPNDIFWVTEGKPRNLSGTHGSTLFWIKLIILYCPSDDSIIRDSLVRYKIETRLFFFLIKMTPRYNLKLAFKNKYLLISFFPDHFLIYPKVEGREKKPS